MARNEIKTWATQFTRDLGKGDTRILFERVLSRHLQKITAIRASGLSWPSIASILAIEGARCADGRLISADHLRAAYSRLHSKVRHSDRFEKDFSQVRSRADSRRYDKQPGKTVPTSKRKLSAPSRQHTSSDERGLPDHHSTLMIGTRSNQLRKAMRRAQTLRRSVDD